MKGSPSLPISEIWVAGGQGQEVHDGLGLGCFASDVQRGVALDVLIIGVEVVLLHEQFHHPEVHQVAGDVQEGLHVHVKHTPYDAVTLVHLGGGGGGNTIIM